MAATTLANAATATFSSVTSRVSNRPEPHQNRLNPTFPRPGISSKSSVRWANASKVTCAKSATAAATASRIAAEVPAGVSTAELLAAAEAAALKGAEVRYSRTKDIGVAKIMAQ